MLRIIVFALVSMLNVGPAFGKAEKKIDAQDILIADFEGDDYGVWKTTGTAFGNGPARGTLPNQMPVNGYLGKGLVNSYSGGDSATGTLTSPAFKIERPYISFLIGGGMHPGKTCINLLVKDKIVRTATGPNDRPGGSEQLDWHSWDVKEFGGQDAVIEIVDQATGGWGHINIDHIIQGNQSKGAALVRRHIEVTKQYLHLPVKNGAPKRRMKFIVGDQTVREFEIELATGRPDYWVFADVNAFRGKNLILEAKLPADAKALDLCRHRDHVPGAGEEGDLYAEANRPQFHFTSRRGWLNDPNGLVYANGEYHLFYQHNPFGWGWGNMHWGHAVSKDLLQWQEVGIALYPKQFGDWCFSGSAVVDKHNTSGWKKGDNDLLVAAFTSTGRGESIVYSNDRGRSWTEFEGNPVVKHKGRDPRLLWHEPTKRWVMAVYNEDKGRVIAFYSSPNFKEWTYHSQIGEFFECPDLFELPVDGDAKKSKWVLYAADGKYLIGSFDGQKFTPESKLQQVWYGNMYAAQTFSDTPDGRRIQIGWARVDFPGMPFNQQMTVPCELTLRSTEEGPRIFVEPARELDRLTIKPRRSADFQLQGELNLLGKNDRAERLRLRASIEPRDASKITINVDGHDIAFETAKKTISYRGISAPLETIDGKFDIDLLMDLASIEVFGNRGRTALSLGRPIQATTPALTIRADGGRATIVSLEIGRIKSTWMR